MNTFQKILGRLCAHASKGATVDEKADFLASILHRLGQGGVEESHLIKHRLYRQRLAFLPLATFDDRLRTYGWFELVQRVAQVEGDIVEAGVGYGFTLLTLLGASAFFKTGKQVYGFDSFAGFPDAHEADIGSRVKSKGRISGWSDVSPAVIEQYAKAHLQGGKFPVNLASLHLVKGFFDQTIPQQAPAKISLLHLDCDLYEGTAHVLAALHPRFARGAIVIFDEYDDPRWPGVKKAVDAFVAEKGLHMEYFDQVLRCGFVVR